MMQHKRSPISVDQSTFMNLMPKRLKIDVPLSSKDSGSSSFLVNGEEREGQLADFCSSTTGLTIWEDRYSFSSSGGNGVYKFFHEQVKVLSAPYLYCTPSQIQGEEACSGLKAKGLCLVPISFTVGVASSNGADIWAPIKTGGPNSRRSISDEASAITYT